VLYPVFTYFGIARVSRAAIGQMQMVYEDANNDDQIFHEFGHEVYYRRMMGDAAYHQAHSCSASAVCKTFPTCGGCIGHSILKDIGPEAAMIEGWADFFEAVAALNVPATNARGTPSYRYIENPSQWVLPTGAGSEMRVAAYLWDFFDDNVFIRDYVDDYDAVVSTGAPKERYRKVAAYFKDMSLSSELVNVWKTKIKPSLGSTDLLNHQTILNQNTLGGVY
jgi:hypothetical protein